MLGHRRRRATQYEPATPTRPKGYGGARRSAALRSLRRRHRYGSVARLASHRAALVTRPTPTFTTGS